jgi:tetratricopeptide (TPR) repeat protein
VEYVLTNIFPDVSKHKHIFFFLEDEHSQGTFQATCKAWQVIADEYFNQTFKQKNIAMRIYPWHEYPRLSPRLLHHLNVNFARLVGIYRNNYSSINGEIKRFKITYQHIMDAPFIEEDSLVKSYAEFLDLCFPIRIPSGRACVEGYDEWCGNRRKELSVRLRYKLLNCRLRENTESKNEMFLYCSFGCNSIMTINFAYAINLLSNDSFLQKISCNLFDVIIHHRELEALRIVQNKTAADWEKIIEFDPALTSNDYYEAGVCFYNDGKFEKSKLCFKSALNDDQLDKKDVSYLIKLSMMARACYDAHDYHNAAHYFDLFFEQLERFPETPEGTFDKISLAQLAADSHGLSGNVEKEAKYRKQEDEKEQKQKAPKKRHKSHRHKSKMNSPGSG